MAIHAITAKTVKSKTDLDCKNSINGYSQNTQYTSYGCLVTAWRRESDDPTPWL